MSETKAKQYERKYITGKIHNLRKFAESQGLAYATVKSYSCIHGWAKKRKEHWADRDISAKEIADRVGQNGTVLNERPSLDIKTIRTLIEKELLANYDNPDKINRKDTVRNLITYLEFINKNVMDESHLNESKIILKDLIKDAKCNIENEIKQSLGLSDIRELSNIT